LSHPTVKGITSFSQPNSSHFQLCLFTNGPKIPFTSDAESGQPLNFVKRFIEKKKRKKNEKKKKQKYVKLLVKKI
jgi:hypothetical protein